MIIELSKEQEGSIHLRSGKLHWDIYSPRFDLKKGFDFLLRAAGCENPEAMYLVGFAYLYGERGTAKDEILAYEWLGKAAETGVGEAQMLVAEKAQKDGDDESALHWYGKAEENNVPMADERKRLLLIKKHNGNPKDTFEWHKEGADLGIPLECFKVGMMYYKGDKVNADIPLAKYYLEKADGQDGAHQDTISETLGDICAFHLNKPLEALSHYCHMSEGDKVLSQKVEQIRSGMGFFERRKFDAEYEKSKQN